MARRTRVGTLISQAIRPFSVRARRDSGASACAEVIPTAKQDYFSRPLTNPKIANRPLSLNIPKPPRIPIQTRSMETIDRAQDEGRLSSRPATQGSENSTRESTTDVPPTEIGDSDSPTLPPIPVLRSDGLPETPPPVPPKDSQPTPPSSRWRFFPFRKDTLQSLLTQESTVSTVNFVPHPLKGEIVCLDYSSLDDRGMRLLEGRSDHRPVIGSYAVYL